MRATASPSRSSSESWWGSFLGWFGPRGLASIVFAVIVWNQGVAGRELLAMTVVCTVTRSIFAHGLATNPLARRLGPHMES